MQLKNLQFLIVLFIVFLLAGCAQPQTPTKKETAPSEPEKPEAKEPVAPEPGPKVAERPKPEPAAEQPPAEKPAEPLVPEAPIEAPEPAVETAPGDAVDVGSLFLTVDELYAGLPKLIKDSLGDSSKIKVVYRQTADNIFIAKFSWDETDLNIIIDVEKYIADAKLLVGKRYSKCIEKFMEKIERSEVLDPNNHGCRDTELDIFGDMANAGLFQETAQARYLKGINFSRDNIFVVLVEYGSEDYANLSMMKAIAGRMDSKLEKSGMLEKKNVYVSKAFAGLLGDRVPVKIVYTPEQIQNYEYQFAADYNKLQEVAARPNNFACDQKAAMFKEVYPLLDVLIAVVDPTHTKITDTVTSGNATMTFGIVDKGVILYSEYRTKMDKIKADSRGACREY